VQRVPQPGAISLGSWGDLGLIRPLSWRNKGPRPVFDAHAGTVIPRGSPPDLVRLWCGPLLLGLPEASQ
jgi:hypothetical protein